MLDDVSTSIQAMAGAEFTLLLIVVVVLTGAGFFIWKKSFQRARVMEDMPTSKVRSAAQGFVELAGTQHALDGTPLAAPLTRSDCTCVVLQDREEAEGSIVQREQPNELGHARSRYERGLLQPPGRNR